MKKFIALIIFFVTIPLFSQENIDLEIFLDKAQVMDITSDGSSIWIATNGHGIYNYNPLSNKWTQFSTAQENIQTDLFYCITANKNFVWAGSTDGLFIYDKAKNSWNRRKFALGGQLANWIRSIAYDEYSNCVWIGRFKYLTKYEVATKKYTDYDLTVKGNDKTNNIKSILVDGDSFVWFGTEAGVHKYDKSKNLSDADSRYFYDIKKNHFNGEGEQASVTSMLSERANIWFGLDEFITDERPDFNLGGLFKYDRKNTWQVFNSKLGLPGNGVYDIERTGNYIWASFYQFGKSTKENFGRGLVLINRLNDQIISINDDRIPKTIYSIFFDGSNIWLGSENGLLKLNFFNKLAQWQRGKK